MDCSTVRDAFVSGTVLPEDQVEAHLASCPQCRELYQRDAELGRNLAREVSATVAFSGDFFGQLEQKLAQETGFRAWLRSRPSGLRFLLLLLPLLVVLIATGALRHRADFAQYPLQRVLLLLTIYFVAILIAFGKELSESPRGDAFRDHWALLAFALGVPFLAAFAPATELSRQAAPSGALGCFAYGALLTLPIALLLWGFNRDDRISLRTVCLSAAALGLSANLMLELHCGNGNAEHVLLGHASLGLAWLAAWCGMRLLSRPIHLRK